MEEAGQIKRALIDATAGAISGAVSRTVTSPLDVIKIRFQMCNLNAGQWDVVTEGFWRGNVPALLMVIPYTAIQFAVMQNLKGNSFWLFQRRKPSEDKSGEPKVLILHVHHK
ncbi:hypothetical protein SASPL_147194 [Salvia splendens]|uniref:Uncharacterized protein n=1 Tax=Salvia splendens TaxID=180675 RepID=A0A8X8WE09_SALSN|nr:hypothetical protein SASPL_147194 [Salvia splendens]